MRWSAVHRHSRIGDVWAPESIVEAADAFHGGDELFGDVHGRLEARRRLPRGCGS